MSKALDTDLDAYLDRELFIQPAPEAKPSPEETPAERLQGVLALAAEEERLLRKRPDPARAAEEALDLEREDCPIPEHLKPKPAPVVSAPAPSALPRVDYAAVPPQAPLPGLAVVPPVAQPWSPLMAPVPGAVPPAPARRTRWTVAWALVGGGAAGALAAGVLWMMQSTLSERTEVREAAVPTSTVTRVTPAPVVPSREVAPVPVAPAAAPVLSVKSSPLPRQPEAPLVDWSEGGQGVVGVSAGPLPGPVVPGRMAATQATEPPARVMAPVPPAVAAAPVQAKTQATQELARTQVAASGPALEAGRSARPAPAGGKAAPVMPRETVQARKAAAEPKPRPRRLIEEPYLNEAEEELPQLAPPPSAPAPEAVAKAMPAPAPRKPSEYADLDEEFARELGFTPDAKPKVPESKGPKAVYIPPDPNTQLPEKLTPQDIQQVVVANQPAIVSCIRRYKDSVPGVAGGKFVVRWFLHPSGSTSGVMMETKELRGTQLGTCLEGLVRGWKFPRHRVQQQEPVRFPFIF